MQPGKLARSHHPRRLAELREGGSAQHPRGKPDSRRGRDEPPPPRTSSKACEDEPPAQHHRHEQRDADRRHYSIPTPHTPRAVTYDERCDRIEGARRRPGADAEAQDGTARRGSGQYRDEECAGPCRARERGGRLVRGWMVGPRLIRRGRVERRERHATKQMRAAGSLKGADARTDRPWRAGPFESVRRSERCRINCRRCSSHPCSGRIAPGTRGSRSTPRSA